MRILLIEPDELTRASAELMLLSEGVKVTTCELGEDGYGFAQDFGFSAIVLELGLPDMNGLTLIKRLRIEKVKTPILVLSGYAEIDLKVRALQAGADDYLTKPFHKDELLARLQALVRRSAGEPESLIEVGDLVVNIERREATARGYALHLTGKEYEMLELLALRKGSTCTKVAFLNHLYGGRDEPELKIIDVFICKLRRKLARLTDQELIHTNWGRGYFLAEPEKAVA